MKNSASPCPTCGKARSEAFIPFCSQRCKDVDLNRWFTGVYAIAAEEKPEEDEEE